MTGVEDPIRLSNVLIEFFNRPLSPSIEVE